MICLAIDTASKNCSACLYDNESDVVLAELSEEIGKGHAERLMGIISDVMESARISYQQIDKIITSIGPGSFTGIRVGVATARGFGLGLDIPIVGVGNLEAMMLDAELNSNGNGPIVAVIQAGRGKIYCQCNFNNELAKANAPFIVDEAALISMLNDFGNPITIAGSAISVLTPHLKCEFNNAENCSQTEVVTIAKIGADRQAGAEKPEPLYLRSPDAIPQKGFAVERVV